MSLCLRAGLLLGAFWAFTACAAPCQQAAEELSTCGLTDAAQAACLDSPAARKARGCAESSADCAALRACVSASTQDDRAARLQRHIANGDPDKAFAACQTIRRRGALPDNLVALCAKATLATLKTLSAAGELAGVLGVCGADGVRTDPAIAGACSTATMEATREATRQAMTSTVPENLATALKPCDRAMAQLPHQEPLKLSCQAAARRFLALPYGRAKDRRARLETTCQKPWVQASPALVDACERRFAAALRELVAEGAFMQLKAACDGPFGRDAGAGFAACSKVIGEVVEDLRERVTAWRDGAGPPSRSKLWAACANLRKLSKLLGPEAKRVASARCEEAAAAQQAGVAVAKVRSLLRPTNAARRALRTAALPWECGPAIEALQALSPSPWQQRHLESVIRACYVDFGVPHLAAAVPGMRYCRYGVQAVLEGVALHGLRGPTLDRWVKRAKARCAVLKPPPAERLHRRSVP